MRVSPRCRALSALVPEGLMWGYILKGCSEPFPLHGCSSGFCLSAFCEAFDSLSLIPLFFSDLCCFFISLGLSLSFCLTVSSHPALPPSIFQSACPNCLLDFCLPDWLLACPPPPPRFSVSVLQCHILVHPAVPADFGITWSPLPSSPPPPKHLPGVDTLCHSQPPLWSPRLHFVTPPP